MMTTPEETQQHRLYVNVYEVRPSPGGSGFDLISEALTTGRLHFSKEHVAVGYATLHSGSNASVIRVYDATGELTATYEQRAASGAAV